MDNPSSSSWSTIILAVKSPIGLYALIVLVTEVILAVIAQKATGHDFTYLLIGMVGTVVLLVIIVGIRIKELLPESPGAEQEKFVRLEERVSHLSSCLQKELDTRPTSDADATFTYDIFLAAPMAGCDNNDQYVAMRREVMKVFNALKTYCGYKVYCAVEECETMDKFNAMDLSAIKDLSAIRESRCFVMLYPARLPSSVIFEAGYALALKKFSTYFVARHEDLPFMLRELGQVSNNVHLHEESTMEANFDSIESRIRIDKTTLFTRTSQVGRNKATQA